MQRMLGLIRQGGVSRSWVRWSSGGGRKAMVVGVYNEKAGEVEAATTEKDLTGAARWLNGDTQGRLLQVLSSCKPLKAGEARVLPGLVEGVGVAAVGLGERGVGVVESEGWDEGREAVRRATSSGAKALRELGFGRLELDGCGAPDAAAEGASLGLWAYDELKSKDRKSQPQLSLLQHEETAAGAEAEWELGLGMGRAQNRARRLMEMPPNLLTPTTFAEEAHQAFKGLNAQVIARDEAWIEEQKMGAMLAVAKGSAEKAVFLEIVIPAQGSTSETNALVGKGVTFDSGGISLKPGASMDEMRADMGGAATVLAAAVGFASLPRPKNSQGLHVLIPLVENMPGSRATRPGDIVRARSNLSIKIDNTDAEGRLILADALSYACDVVQPRRIVDLATLTGAVHVALGNAAAAVFSNSDDLCRGLQAAGVATGERLWRMPLYKHYAARLATPYADLNNIAKPGSGAGSCTAAAFLQKFVSDKVAWAHVDMAGVMKADGEVPYIASGMTGSPTRSLLHWLRSLQ